MKEIADKIVECEKEQEQLRVQREAKLRKIGNLISDTCVIDNNEVCLHCLLNHRITTSRSRSGANLVR